MKKTPSDSSYERWMRKRRERDADMFRRGEEHYKHLRGLKGRIQIIYPDFAHHIDSIYRFDPVCNDNNAPITATKSNSVFLLYIGDCCGDRHADADQ